jgi:hypothetical protein
MHFKKNSILRENSEWITEFGNHPMVYVSPLEVIEFQWNFLTCHNFFSGTLSRGMALSQEQVSNRLCLLQNSSKDFWEEIMPE